MPPTVARQAEGHARATRLFPPQTHPVAARRTGGGLRARRARRRRATGRRRSVSGGIRSVVGERRARPSGAAHAGDRHRPERDRQEFGPRDDDDRRPRPSGPARRAAVDDHPHREAARRPQDRHRQGSAALHRRHQLPRRRGRRGGHPAARLLAHLERRHLRRQHPRPGLLRPRRVRLRPHRGAARFGIDAVRARLERRRRQPGEQGSPAHERERALDDVRQRPLPASHRRLQPEDVRYLGVAHQRDDHQRRQLGQRDRQVRHRAGVSLGHRHERRVHAGLLLPREPQRHQLRHAVAAPRRVGRHLGGQPGRPDPDRPEALLRCHQRLQQRLCLARHLPAHAPLRRRRAAAHHPAPRRLRPRPARVDDPLLHARRHHQPRLPGGRADPIDHRRLDRPDPGRRQRPEQGPGPDTTYLQTGYGNTFEGFGRRTGG